ncbi:MAG: hypothetical protein DSY70_00690 [Desulfobulbus sp.]|nr:MAG: hypothetical protein DSY70_00690 [Desulfobulbus sp.]
MSVESLECRVNNPKGIHCRVATRIAEIVSSHDSQVQIAGSEKSADCTSILDILSLALTRNSRVVFTADGRDAAVVLDALQSLLAKTEDP